MIPGVQLRSHPCNATTLVLLADLLAKEKPDLARRLTERPRMHEQGVAATTYAMLPSPSEHEPG